LPAVADWRIYRDDPAPGIVELGLERVREERRLLRRTSVVEERVLGRRFAARDLVASGRYHTILRQAVERLAAGTFGTYVDIDPMGDGVRVRLVRRTIGPERLDVAISDERHFAADQVSASADYAEELRALARDENDAFWAAARDAAEQASAQLEDARERARDAAELSQILQSQEEAP
jgi:hypothetical protein